MNEVAEQLRSEAEQLRLGLDDLHTSSGAAAHAHGQERTALEEQLQQARERIRDVEVLQGDSERLRTERDELQAERERLRAEGDPLLSELEQLRQTVERAETALRDQRALFEEHLNQARVEASGVAELRGVHERLQTESDQLRTERELLRTEGDRVL